MKTKEIEALESYFNTENQHWNKYAFDLLCEVVKEGNFENPEIPLRLFNDSIDTISAHHDHPLKTVQILTGEMDKQELTPIQKQFVCEWVYKYLKGSEFDFDHTPIKELLFSHKEKLKAETQPVKPLTNNIRDTLKEMMQKEIEQLPETLNGLEPIQRLNILCKLMPFILPKVESISHEAGEPKNNTFKLILD